MIWLLVFASIGFILWAISTVIPQPKSHSAERARLMNIIGFTSAQQSAELIGWKLKTRDYLLLLVASILGGYAIAVISGNHLFVVVGAVLCFFVPKYLISIIQYKRRKEILLDLPHNLRLLTSKFRDCKSLQKSLEASLPLMSGVTKPSFEELYQSLEVGIDITVALRRMQRDLRFQKFNDLCDKLILGNREGFTTRAVDSIRESIEDITSDIQILQNLDIENKNKRVQVHAFVFISWTFPFLFSYMESELDSIRTLDTLIGKILLVTFFLSSLLTYVMRDKYLSLNLNEL